MVLTTGNLQVSDPTRVVGIRQSIEAWSKPPQQQASTLTSRYDKVLKYSLIKAHAPVVQRPEQSTFLKQVLLKQWADRGSTPRWGVLISFKAFMD